MDGRTVLIERGPNGTILVRVPSRSIGGYQPPDAVFTFRCGDPQFEYWMTQLGRQETQVQANAVSSSS